MALNKKEQAQFEELREQLKAEQHRTRVAKALSWTQPVKPDIAPPEAEGLTTGFLYNAYSGFGGDRVIAACSGAVSHGRGQTNKTTTQGARRLYSTKLLALQAMRHEVEKECAARLAEIDLQIETELATA